MFVRNNNCEKLKFWQLVVVIIHNNILKFESFAKDRKIIITIIYLFSKKDRPKVRNKIEKNNVNSMLYSNFFISSKE